MLIQINERYRIISDEVQWTVQHLPKKREGIKRKEDRWINRGHFATLDTALMWASHQQIKLIPGTVDADNIIDIVHAIDKIHREIGRAYSTHDAYADEDARDMVDEKKNHRELTKGVF